MSVMVQEKPNPTEAVTSPPMLAVRALRKSFGGIQVLQELSLEFEDSLLHGLVGSNGAGKSTLINCITGMEQVDAGKIYYAGTDITGTKTHLLIPRGIGRTFQYPRLTSGLTALENVTLATTGHWSWVKALAVGGKPSPAERRKAEEALALCGIKDYAHVRSEVLSPAQRRLVEIARALITKPRLLLLDEPTAGMNEEEAEELGSLLLHIQRERGMTIVVVSHTLPFLFKIADQVAWLKLGRLRRQVPPDTLMNDPEFLDDYIGRR